MAQSRDEIEKVEELNSIFTGLNEKGKDSALTILRALSFAQAVMGSESGGPDQPPPKNRPSRRPR